MLRTRPLAASMALVAGAALAEDREPGVSADLVIELESGSVVSADDPETELTDVFATIEGALEFRVSRALAFGTSLTFEPVRDPIEDRFFEDHGLYAEELFVSLTYDVVTLRGGKINPAFALAWDAAPGIYGVDFAEDYELAEQIGFDAAVPFALGGAEHTLSAAVFFTDTTFLSRSVFLDRGRTQLADGGAGNTETLESVAVALDGAIGETGYQLAFRRRAEPDAGGAAEIGGSATAFRSFALGESEELALLGEIVFLDNFDGADESALYATASAAYTVDRFTLSGSYTLRDIEDAGDTDHLATTTLDYAILESLSLGVGYRYGEEGGEASHTLGVKAVYETGF